MSKKKLKLVYEMNPDDLTYQDLKREYERLWEENKRLEKDQRELIDKILHIIEDTGRTCWSVKTPVKMAERIFNLVYAYSVYRKGVKPWTIFTRDTTLSVGSHRAKKLSVS